MPEAEPRNECSSETSERLGKDAVRFSPSPESDEDYHVASDGSYTGDGPPLLIEGQTPISNLLPSIFKAPEE